MPLPDKRLARIQIVAKWVLGICWLYQGIVPKLLFPFEGEMPIMQATGLFDDCVAYILLQVLGVAEAAFGLFLILAPPKRWAYMANLVVLGGLALGSCFFQPGLLKGPFNPVSISMGMVGLGLTGLLSLPGREE